ncbi:hypothetical protein [Nonomuraea sp. JJY05]|uniref:DUF7779 domain-containing protein n=1 Tax=Nonomuraea sp. JJY05 TaxID=3350255 RepID=UPI00373EAB96
MRDATQDVVKQAANQIWDVPPPVATFAFRDGELDSIQAAYRQHEEAGSHAVVVLFGLPGVGKSQLSLAYAHRHAMDALVCWRVDASSLDSLTFDLAQLARRMRIETVDDAEAAEAIVTELAARTDWFLLFDNASSPDLLRAFMPQRGGRVLVTSRSPAWEAMATTIEVEPFSQEAATRFLLHRTSYPGGDGQAAEVLAEELAGLPLALEQVSAYCRLTGIALADYMHRYRRERLLDKAAPGEYEMGSVTATVILAMRLAMKQHPAAGQLLMVYAFLAPIDIPRDLPLLKPTALPKILRRATGREADFDEVVRVLLETSLVTVDQQGTLRMHQLVQQIVRTQAVVVPVRRSIFHILGFQVKPSDLKAGIASLEWGLVVGDLLIKAQALLAELLEDVDLNDEELDEQQVAYKEISRTISFQAMHYHAIMADQHEELARLHIEMAEKL